MSTATLIFSNSEAIWGWLLATGGPLTTILVATWFAWIAQGIVGDQNESINKVALKNHELIEEITKVDTKVTQEQARTTFVEKEVIEVKINLAAFQQRVDYQFDDFKRNIGLRFNEAQKSADLRFNEAQKSADLRFNAFQKYVDFRFHQVDLRFNQVDARFDKLESKFDSKFDQVISILLNQNKKSLE